MQNNASNTFKGNKLWRVCLHLLLCYTSRDHPRSRPPAQVLLQPPLPDPLHSHLVFFFSRFVHLKEATINRTALWVTTETPNRGARGRRVVPTGSHDNGLHVRRGWFGVGRDDKHKIVKQWFQARRLKGRMKSKAEAALLHRILQRMCRASYTIMSLRERSTW